MKTNFDLPINRLDSDSGKWGRYGEDVLPMWVADMDFLSPQPILDAMRQRIDHGVFGYGQPPYELREVLAERLATRHQWSVEPDQVTFLPGLVCALNLFCRAFGKPGGGVLVNTPVYMPFLSAPVNQGQETHVAELACTTINANGHERLHYEIDFDALEEAIQPHTRLFILCNPHNPVGRAYTQDELAHIAELCLKHDLILCSDEIHCDLTMADNKHISIASLSPQMAERTITLIAPSKTFNIPGLGCSAAIIQNMELRQQFDQAAKGIVPHVNLLGYEAGMAAYTQCDDWHDGLLAYLSANRDFITHYVDSHLPTIRTTCPEATYLAWLDCREAGIEGTPQEFFLKEAKVAFSDGAAFGQGGEGFVRLNYGCTKAILEQGLERVRNALNYS
ncbi:MAG: PatB family C-S lyase [Chloroflexota bacterium]